MTTKLIIQIIAGLLLLLYLAYLWRRWSKKYSVRELTDASLDLGEHTSPVEQKLSRQCNEADGSAVENCATCAVGDCSVRSTLSRLKNAPEYYDDEELDALAHRSPETYTPDELSQLQEVLETLRDADVNGWLRSLSQRGIALPEPLHREAARRIART